MILYRAACCSGVPIDLYSGGAWFESFCMNMGYSD
jgi:hypothetical protein